MGTASRSSKDSQVLRFHGLIAEPHIYANIIFNNHMGHLICLLRKRPEMELQDSSIKCNNINSKVLTKKMSTKRI